METEKLKKEITKYLKKTKEQKIIELIITNYNNSNFYIALLYNTKISKLKVLYLPLDIIDSIKIKDYCCYQFMEIRPMSFALKQIKDSLKNYKEKSSRDFRNKNMPIMDIELNIYMDKEKYDFHMTRYLPKKLNFLFETISLLFEHIPNILNELGNEILSLSMNQTEEINYQLCLECLEEKDLDNYFKLKLPCSNLTNLEKINNKYYAIIEDNLVIVEYLSNHFTIYTSNPAIINSNYTYQVLKTILSTKRYPFTKIKIKEKETTHHYLCFKNKKGKIMIIKNNKIKSLPKTKIEVVEDINNLFKKS